MTNYGRVGLALLLLVGLLAACGRDKDEAEDENGQPQEAPRSLTLQPLPEQTLVPGCQALDLEDWTETTYFNMQTFVYESRATVVELNDANRGIVANTLGRLLDLRDQVARAPTPQCVQESARQVLVAMQGVVDGFQGFVNGEIGKAEAEQGINTNIETISTLLNTLLDNTAPLYRITPSSSDGSGGNN